MKNFREYRVNKTTNVNLNVFNYQYLTGFLNVINEKEEDRFPTSQKPYVV